MNTKLISQWTMSGALQDIDNRLRATDDIDAAIQDSPPMPEPTRPASTSVLTKEASADVWQLRGD